jgi:hypothetical protein
MASRGHRYGIGARDPAGALPAQSTDRTTNATKKRARFPTVRMVTACAVRTMRVSRGYSPEEANQGFGAGGPEIELPRFGAP